MEALIIAWPLRALKLDRDPAEPKALLVFYALALGPATACSAFLGSLYLHLAAGAPMLQTAGYWYSSTALGQTILVPALMTVRWDEMKAMVSPKALPGTALLLALVAAAIAANYFLREYPFAFLFFPAVLLLTFQRGFAGGTAGTLMTGAYMLLPLLLDDPHSAMRGHSVREQIMIVQMYIAVLGFTVALVGAALEQRRRLERRLAEAHEEALVARDTAEQASSAKTMFLANMSHELRTPLNAVIGFSEIMNAELYGPLGDARYREYAATIEQAGRHLLDLIGDILDMSKIEAGKYHLEREEISADEIITGCVELMRERARKSGVKLTAEFQGQQRFLADPRAMKQILLNLLSNAIKFTPPGGRVIVSSAAESERYTLCVSDTGIGIPPEEIKRLGNPFVQLRRVTAGISHQGTGLGLALVRALVEMHHGTISIESIEGQGTTVRVELPREPARMAA